MALGLRTGKVWRHTHGLFFWPKMGEAGKGTWQQRERGFTLLELLVAIVILAIMGALAYRSLDAVLDSEQHLAGHYDRWRDVSLGLMQLELLFDQAAPIPGRSAYGEPTLAFEGRALRRGVDVARLEFTLMGDPALPEPVQTPRRVGLRLADDTLELVAWRSPQLPPRNEGMRVVPILSGVQSWSINYLGSDGTWSEVWPPPNVKEPPALPRAVAVDFALTDLGNVRREYALPW